MPQVISGLRIAAATLLAIATAGLLFVGVEIVRSPGSHSLILGCVFLIIATTILIVAMNRWVKALPGILIYATLSGLIMIAYGHLINKPSIPISRLDAVIVTLLMAGSSALSLTFKGRRLHVGDRIALLAFVFCMAWSASPKSSTMFTAMGIGVCCLLIGWAYDRIQRRRGHNHRPASTPGAVGLS